MPAAHVRECVSYLNALREEVYANASCGLPILWRCSPLFVSMFLARWKAVFESLPALCVDIFRLVILWIACFEKKKAASLSRNRKPTVDISDLDGESEMRRKHASPAPYA